MALGHSVRSDQDLHCPVVEHSGTATAIGTGVKNGTGTGIVLVEIVSDFVKMAAVEQASEAQKWLQNLKVIGHRFGHSKVEVFGLAADIH